MRPLAAVLALSLLLAGASAACGGDDAGTSSEAGADSLTPRQRDSVLGESSVPGASGVKGALEASDRARERAAQVDSAGGRPDR